MSKKNVNQEDNRFEFRPQIVQDHITQIVKVAAHPNLRIDQKIVRLTDMARQFRSGYPFGANILASYGQGEGYANLLERMALSSADQLHRINLVRMGRDLGKLDKTDLDPELAYSTEKLAEKKKGFKKPAAAKVEVAP
jgi:hypothetical protein